MQTLFSDQRLTYTGLNLRSGWIEETFGLGGEAMVAWIGPAHVPTKNLVDQDDARAGAEIHAALMLHFLAEHPGDELFTTVLRQRLLVTEALELLRSACPTTDWHRRGDDLYLGDRKLSVSIAAPSPDSGLIHFALNVDPRGAPVPAVGLQELGLNPREFALRLLEVYGSEMAQAAAACLKVREVD